VPKHYTTYAAYFKLLKACADDPNVERKKAAKALARFMKLHPHNVAQKTEVMVEYFNTMTRHKIGGRAKAMVVTGRVSKQSGTSRASTATSRRRGIRSNPLSPCPGSYRTTKSRCDLSSTSDLARTSTRPTSS
jgi:hypothetical protein